MILNEIDIDVVVEKVRGNYRTTHPNPLLVSEGNTIHPSVGFNSLSFLKRKGRG